MKLSKAQINNDLNILNEVLKLYNNTLSLFPYGEVITPPIPTQLNELRDCLLGKMDLTHNSKITKDFISAALDFRGKLNNLIAFLKEKNMLQERVPALIQIMAQLDQQITLMTSKIKQGSDMKNVTKQIDLLYKLATYGSRESFLKSLAQNTRMEPEDATKALNDITDEVAVAISYMNEMPGDAYLSEDKKNLARLIENPSFGQIKFIVKRLNGVLQHLARVNNPPKPYINEIYNNLVKSLSNITAKYELIRKINEQNPIPYVPEREEIKSVPVSELPDAPKPQFKSKLPSIDPIFQTMLGVNPDGILGPQTQTALNKYKETIGSPDWSNELTYHALKQEPEYASKSKMDFDDNSLTYNRTSNQNDQVATN